MYELDEMNSRQPDMSLLLASRPSPEGPNKLFEGFEGRSRLVRDCRLPRAKDYGVSDDRQLGRLGGLPREPDGSDIPRRWRVHAPEEDQYLEEHQFLPGFRILISRSFEGI